MEEEEAEVEVIEDHQEVEEEYVTPTKRESATEAVLADSPTKSKHSPNPIYPIRVPVLSWGRTYFFPRRDISRNPLLKIPYNRTP